MTAPHPHDVAMDVTLPELLADYRRLSEGAHAEQRHQLFDLDADSYYPVPAAIAAHPEVTR